MPALLFVEVDLPTVAAPELYPLGDLFGSLKFSAKTEWERQLVRNVSRT